MSVWWYPGTVLGILFLMFLYEYTRFLIAHWLEKREDRKLEEVLKKSLDYFRSPEYQKLKEDTLREMENDDLYKSVH